MPGGGMVFANWRKGKIKKGEKFFYMARKSKSKRSSAETKPAPHMEANTGSVPEANIEFLPTHLVEANHFGHKSVEDFEIWLSTLMGGADWERHVDAFSDETC
jgi:hypothetical protein